MTSHWMSMTLINVGTIHGVVASTFAQAMELVRSLFVKWTNHEPRIDLASLGITPAECQPWLALGPVIQYHAQGEFTSLVRYLEMHTFVEDESCLNGDQITQLQMNHGGQQRYQQYIDELVKETARNRPESVGLLIHSVVMDHSKVSI